MIDKQKRNSRCLPKPSSLISLRTGSSGKIWEWARSVLFHRAGMKFYSTFTISAPSVRNKRCKTRPLRLVHLQNKWIQWINKYFIFTVIKHVFTHGTFQSYMGNTMYKIYFMWDFIDASPLRLENCVYSYPHELFRSKIQCLPLLSDSLLKLFHIQCCKHKCVIAVSSQEWVVSSVFHYFVTLCESCDLEPNKSYCGHLCIWLSIFF